MANAEGGRLLDVEELSENDDLEKDDDFDNFKHRLPFNGQIRLSITLPVIILACYYSKVPIHLYDLYHLLVSGAIPFANMLALIPADLQKRLKPSHLSMCKNPVQILK